MKRFGWSKAVATGLTAMAAVATQAQDEGTNYAELQRLTERAEARFFAEKMAATMAAQRLNLPIRFVDPETGVVREIMKLAPSGRPVYWETRNKLAAQIVRATPLYPGGGSGFNINGSTVAAALWDAGVVRAAHQEFQGRATYHNAVPLDTHATHAAGTIGAGGVGTVVINGTPTPEAARGIAYGLKALYSYDWNNMEAEMADRFGAPTTFASLSNHPFGPTTGWANGDFGAGPGWYWFGDPTEHAAEDGAFGRYDSTVANFDSFVAASGRYRTIWAVGNDRGEGPLSQPTGFFWNGSAWTANTTSRSKDGGDFGYDTVSGQALGKNVISVGAVAMSSGYAGPASVTLASFSSCGPTDDGRIKPDVVAPGVGLCSPTSGTNSTYATLSGTSQASSVVTGALSLVLQRNLETHGEITPSAATYKGLLIHTAHECGPAPGPDYQFGWGLINTEAALWFLEHRLQEQEKIVEIDKITQGESDLYRVTSNGVDPIRLTLTWTDPAGTATNAGVNDRTKKLVHDLDLRLRKVSPGGVVTYMPWTLNPDEPTDFAQPGDNNTDNVEVIDVPAPPAGLYEMVVSHKGSITGNQFYTLFSSGIQRLPRGLAITTYGTYITGTNSTNARVQTVFYNAPAGGAKIWVRTEPEGAIKIQNPLTVPPGQALLTFPVVGGGDVAVNTPYTFHLHLGYATVSSSGILIPLRINSLTVTPNPVQAGQSVTVTIKMNGPAPAGGKVITIDRSPTYWVMAPASVTIPQGQSQITFQVPIRAGAPAINNARITVIQDILPSGTVSLSKLFNIVP